MRATTLLVSVAVAGCTALAPEEEWPEAGSFDRARVAPTPASDREIEGSCVDLVPRATHPIDGDLALDFERRGAGAIEPGQWLEIRARIRNGADADERRVVLSSDGSEVGWREPHVWFTAYVQEPGSECAIEVPQRSVARCGMFDQDWHDEVIELGPGDARELEWLGNPSYSLDLAAMPAGKVTMFLHYAFTAGKTGKGGSSEPVDLGPMAGQPAFEVVSNPIVLELQRPLRLELAPRRDAKKSPTRLGDLFTLQLRNVTDEARTIAPVDGYRLRFEVQGTEQSWPQAQSGGEGGKARRLAPGKAMTLPLDGYTWVHPIEETVRVRAYLRPYDAEDKASVEVASDWVELAL